MMKCLFLLLWLLLASPLFLGKLLYDWLCDITDRLRWWLEDDLDEFESEDDSV